MLAAPVSMDWFWLYRPHVPSVRAQSIQVVHSAWAMAARGHHVTLCVQGKVSSEAVLAAYGLGSQPTLDLVRLPVRNAAASWAYRAVFARWVLRTHGRGIGLARNKRHAAWALRWFGRRFRLLVEAHEVDSVQSVRLGLDPRVAMQLETRVLAGAHGVVANCEGTLAWLRRAHRVLPPAIVAHNGALQGPGAVGEGSGIGLVGSLRPYKDPKTVALAAAHTKEVVHWIGPPRADVEALQPFADGRLVWEPPLCPARVPARLARFRTLLLPLSAGLFGEALTSPLKLWDALQSGVPLVAADTAAIRAAAEGAYVPYRPGDAASLLAALSTASTDPSLRRRVLEVAALRARSWDQRAAEIDAFAQRVTP